MAAARTSFDLSAAAMRRASRSDFVDDPTVVRLSLRKRYHSVRTSDRRCQRKPPPELRAGREVDGAAAADAENAFALHGELEVAGGFLLAGKRATARAGDRHLGEQLAGIARVGRGEALTARHRRLLETGFARDGELDRHLPLAGLNVVLREGVVTGAEREHERAQGRHSFHANLQSGSYAALRALPARSSRPAATSALRMRSTSA